MWGDFWQFYSADHVNEVIAKVADIGAFFIHIWNSMLTRGSVKVNMIHHDSIAAYAEFVKVYCPKTFASVETF
jgi:hypothetical protein